MFWIEATPVLPLAIRAVVFGVWFRHHCGTLLTDAERELDTYRSTLSTLAGFSLAAALGFSVLDTSGYSIEQRAGIEQAIFLLGMTFLMFLLAFNFQGHKHTRWDSSVISIGLLEGASAALLLALLGAVNLQQPGYHLGLLVCAAGVFLFQFGSNLLAIIDYLRGIDIRTRENAMKEKEKKTTDSRKPLEKEIVQPDKKSDLSFNRCVKCGRSYLEERILSSMRHS